MAGGARTQETPDEIRAAHTSWADYSSKYPHGSARYTRLRTMPHPDTGAVAYKGTNPEMVANAPPNLRTTEQQAALDALSTPTGQAVDGEASEIEEDEAVRAKLRADRLLRAAKRVQNEVYGQVDRDQYIIDKVVESIVALPTLAEEPPALPAPATHRRAEEACVVLSDLHAGELIDPAETGGIGGFSFTVWQQRILSWERAVTSIIRERQAARPITHMNVFMLGDLVTGMLIYLGQLAHIDLNTIEQVTRSARFLSMVLKRFLDRGVVKSISLFAVPGNHGRLGQKKEALPASANMDYALVEFMKAWLRDEPRIHVDNGKALFMLAERQGALFLMVHGDQIRSWNSIPYYGAERYTRRMRDILGEKPKYILVGHHHTSANWDQADCEIFFNGCLPGPSEFSVNQLATGSLPTQWLLFLHPEWGITARYPLRLAKWDEIRKVHIYRGDGSDGLGDPDEDEAFIREHADQDPSPHHIRTGD